MQSIGSTLLLLLTGLWFSLPAVASGFPQISDLEFSRKLSEVERSDGNQAAAKSQFFTEGLADMQPGKTGFRQVYLDAVSPKYKQVQERLKSANALDDWIQLLNNLYKIPIDVPVVMTECGAPMAYHKGSSHKSQIVFCYEIVNLHGVLFQESGLSGEALDRAVYGALLSTFIHEVGHSLAFVLSLPIVGKEEDAVDQLAAILLMQAGPDGAEMALHGAKGFALLQDLVKIPMELQMTDSHSISKQRYYNILCLVYGSDPEKYAALAAEGLMPQRAEKCSAEFQNTFHGWRTLLAPYKRDPIQFSCAEVVDYMMVELYPRYLHTLAQEERAQMAHDQTIEQMVKGAMRSCESEPWTQTQRWCVRSAKFFNSVEGCLK